MHTRISLWTLAALIVVLSAFVVDVRRTYAQEEEEVVVTQVFFVSNPNQRNNVGRSNAQPCQVTAELRWYKTKIVSVIYHWQACANTPADIYRVRWEIASIRNAHGNLALSPVAGEANVYKEKWSDLAAGDKITLRTWINDVRQADVVTEYQESSPIWTRIHTRADQGGACFQFTGHVDPWGVFTAGDHSYTFELTAQDWETPWVAGPNQPTVDWHVVFYRDAALTQVRSEYWFNDVANPCYSEPPSCDDVALSIANGADIPEGGADVTVTITGQNGEQYRIVDPAGNEMAGPSADNVLTFHAMPGITYQAQVYREGYDWTKSGCQFAYATTPPPSCDDIALSIANGTDIPEGGADVTVAITGQNGERYRIVDPAGSEMAEPSADNVLTFHAMPGITYQAQVYREGYGWTKSGCQFAYTTPPPICNGVELSIPTTDLIPLTGADVQVTINGQHSTHYRVVDAAGTVVAGPSTENKLQLHVLGGIPYQAQVYNETYGWTDSGCEFVYTPVSPEAACGSVSLVPGSKVIPATGADVQATINATSTYPDPLQYRIVDEDGVVKAGPSDSNQLSIVAMPLVGYQAEILDPIRGWVSSQGCAFNFEAPPPVIACVGVTVNLLNDATAPEGSVALEVTITGKNALYHRIVDSTGQIMVGPSTENILRIHATPGEIYQAQVAGEGQIWTAEGCGFHIDPLEPICNGVGLSIQNGSIIPESGADVTVTVAAENATRYQIVDEAGTVVAGPSDSPVLQFHAMPLVTYQAQVANATHDWSTQGCTFRYNIDNTLACEGVTLSPPNGSEIDVSGVDVQATISGRNATNYRIVDENGKTMAGPSNDRVMHFHAMPSDKYQAEIANADHSWTTSNACRFNYRSVQGEALAFCQLDASHYGDPGGISRILAGVKGQTAPVAIERIEVNWNHRGKVTYPTKEQPGPWFTNTPFELDSRPDVHDIGFGYYRFEALVYVAGISEPAFCTGDGNAPDHDNVLPDPGPFAKANPEGKFNRGGAPSRLPTVGRLPFDGGNGPDKVELILWAFDKEGRGMESRITAIANEGKPLARLGMESVSNVVKFDGLNAREGIVYGFQIGEHGPWSPLFCPKADGNPTTITVYWAAGGQTWLSDGAAFGDCWWLTVAAALNGWVTVDESVATYNALQGIIDWNGHRNLTFSLAQSRETGLGPRMQDEVIGLKAREWQGPVIPTIIPPDFWQVVDGYRNAQ